MSSLKSTHRVQYSNPSSGLSSRLLNSSHRYPGDKSREEERQNCRAQKSPTDLGQGQVSEIMQQKPASGVWWELV